MSIENRLGSVQELELGGRQLVCWVPNSINQNTPILIAHDAQNYMIDRDKTWNGRNWRVVETIEAGELHPDAHGNLPLIASVHLTDTTYRLNELAAEDFMREHPEAWDMIDPSLVPPHKELFGNAYADAVALNVIPELCEKFGIEHDAARTAISGSSMGGVASLYAITRHPEVYATALAYSTHFPLGGNAFVDYIVDALPVDGKHRFYIDRGTLEIDAGYAPDLERAKARMLARGLKENRDFAIRVIEDTGHNEDYWAARFAEVTNWWLGNIDG